MNDKDTIALDEAIAAVWFVAYQRGLTKEQVIEAWQLHQEHATCFGVAE